MSELSTRPVGHLSHSKAYLLIGGLHDGQTRTIAYEPEEISITWPAVLPSSSAPIDRARVTAASMTLVAKDLYRKTVFTTPGRRIVVYAHETLDAGDVLEALVCQYPRR